MSKEKLVFVTDAETLAAIERNDFNSPVPGEIMPNGVWVYQWSLGQYKAGCNERASDPVQCSDGPRNS